MNKLFFLRFIHDPAQDTFEIDKNCTSAADTTRTAMGFSSTTAAAVPLSLLKDLHQMQQEGQVRRHLRPRAASRLYRNRR